MNEPFSEELLSAYVDGELSASERAEVERWLEQHPSARDKLEDFRRLSQMFGNLPRTEVPDEFRTQVLQRAERRMLLPDPAAPRKPGGKRGWLLALAAPLASAAVLVLTVQFLERGEAKRGKQVALEAERLAAPAVHDRFRKDRIVAEPFDAPISELGSNVTTDGTLVAPANPQLAAIDEAVHRLLESRSEDKVMSVVKVYVADRASGLVLMQRILEDNNIPGERRVYQREAGEKRDADPQAALSGNDALYIVAEPEELIAAFTEMLNRRHPDLRVDVEAPVALAMLDDASRIQFQKVEKEFAEINQRRDDADWQAAPAPAAAKPTDSKPAGLSGKAPAALRPIQPDQGSESAALQKGAADQKQNADKEVSQKNMAAGQKKSEAAVPAGPAEKTQSSQPNVANQSNGNKNADQPRNSASMRGSASISGRRAEPAEGDANRQMSVYSNSNSRQAVVNLSPAFESRQRNSPARREANYDPPGNKPTGAASRPTPADEVSSEAGKAPIEEKLQQQPALVRMLIVIEPEER
jgi:anti-sigma factor RsiW